MNHEIGGNNSRRITRRARFVLLTVGAMIIGLAMYDRAAAQSTAFGGFFQPRCNYQVVPYAPRTIPVESAYPRGQGFVPRPPAVTLTPGGAYVDQVVRARVEEAARSQPIRYPWGYFGAQGGSWSSRHTGYYDNYTEWTFGSR